MFQLCQPLILASNSPRRKQLLRDCGFTFEVQVLHTDENFPDGLETDQVASFISCQKAKVFQGLYPEHLVLTADTIVAIDNQILGKPADHDDAVRMLASLSGRTHEVITAVSLLVGDRIETVSDIALVSFKALTAAEIDYYVTNYKPYDKAGAYGVQEWIGMIGINKIEGSYYTIMGLPVHLVYELLQPYTTN